jgi:hypothetical protein
MNINLWGPACWNLFHTLAEKIKEDHFPIIGQHLYNQILLICQNLPCPDCALHAKQFLSKINPTSLKNKHDLKNLLYVFHNKVNETKQKSLFKYEDLLQYRQFSIIHLFNTFSKTYNSNGNLTLIADNMQRRHIVANMKKWLMQNLSHFEI